MISILCFYMCVPWAIELREDFALPKYSLTNHYSPESTADTDLFIQTTQGDISGITYPDAVFTAVI